MGKTALVEGLALAIVKGEVPDLLKNTELVSLDMGLLNAGASVKGEFERRLKAVISEIKASPIPIIMFIDEAHTIIGAGGAKGGSDASNLLKPALARGELRTVAATTWTEFKKYFEKDPALERRFQPVKCDEPSVADTIVMLRGLAGKYETAHGVTIRDEAVVAAAELSSRYISGRQLPDKAVDLLDTAAARVKVEQGAKPQAVEALELELASFDRQRVALERDIAEHIVVDRDKYAALLGDIESITEQVAEMTARWVAERDAVREFVAACDALRVAEKAEAEKAARKAAADKARTSARTPTPTSPTPWPPWSPRPPAIAARRRRPTSPRSGPRSRTGPRPWPRSAAKTTRWSTTSATPTSSPRSSPTGPGSRSAR